MHSNKITYERSVCCRYVVDLRTIATYLIVMPAIRCCAMRHRRPSFAIYTRNPGDTYHFTTNGALDAEWKTNGISLWICVCCVGRLATVMAQMAQPQNIIARRLQFFLASLLLLWLFAHSQCVTNGTCRLSEFCALHIKAQQTLCMAPPDHCYATICVLCVCVCGVGKQTLSLYEFV